PFGFPLGTIRSQPVAMYGTASETASRFCVTYSAVHTMSQRPAVRSGMRPAKETFRTSMGSPQALATARAASTSKPTAWFGSVTDVDGKYSMGGYSMSTQSVTVPALTRLVGAVTLTSLAPALPPVLGEVPPPPPPDWPPAMMRPTARAANRTMADGRVTSSPLVDWLAGCVRIADLCTLSPMA